MIRITVRQMEYFDALAQTLHFGRAAELTGVSQPALSAQIAEMEERLGCPLFDRSARGVRLTDEALGLKPRIERVLGEIHEIEATARQDRLAMERRLRLGIIPTVAPFLLPAILPELKRRYPFLLIEIREAVTAALVEETSAGRLDGFIAALPLDFPGIATQELFRDRFFLAVPADDPHLVAPPIAPESAVLERLMLLEDGHCMRDQALAVCGRVRPATMTSYRATSLTTLLQMVSHGLGVTLLPEMAVQPAAGLRGIRVLPFTEPAPSRSVCLGWRRNGPRQGECIELAHLIRALHAGAPPAPRAPAAAGTEAPMPS